eukprot:m.21189 g.21189  ORF g.21189 m.21189 type:complete len:85 (+) comp8254_c0_seq2:1553-1807(+)
MHRHSLPFHACLVEVLPLLSFTTSTLMLSCQASKKTATVNEKFDRFRVIVKWRLRFSALCFVLVIPSAATTHPIAYNVSYVARV